MAVDEKTRESLDLKILKLPKSMPVTKVYAEEYFDSSGEEALRVQVILDESFDEYHIDGRAVGDLKRAIHQSLLDHGITLFPYVFLAKQSELDELERDGD